MSFDPTKAANLKRLKNRQGQDGSELAQMARGGSKGNSLRGKSRVAVNPAGKTKGWAKPAPSGPLRAKKPEPAAGTAVNAGTAVKVGRTNNVARKFAPVGPLRERSIPGAAGPKVTPVMPVKRRSGKPATEGKPVGLKRAAANRFSKRIKKGAFKGLQKRF